jgi:hypothetical protein
VVEDALFEHSTSGADSALVFVARRMHDVTQPEEFG